MAIVGRQDCDALLGVWDFLHRCLCRFVRPSNRDYETAYN